jgi:hypothetical protein
MTKVTDFTSAQVARYCVLLAALAVAGAMIAMWSLSYSHPVVRDFDYRGSRWEIRSASGRITLTNEPEHDAALARLQKYLAVVDQRMRENKSVMDESIRYSIELRASVERGERLPTQRSFELSTLPLPPDVPRLRAWSVTYRTVGALVLAATLFAAVWAHRASRKHRGAFPVAVGAENVKAALTGNS